MPRKKRVYKNKEFLKPDPRFDNLVLSRFINQIMRMGKKTVAQKVVYGALDIVSEKTKDDPLTVFDTAMRNVSPVLEVKGKRIGGANYQIAQEVRGDRKEALAMRWIKEAAKKRGGHTMAEKLASELMDAANKEGGAMKKREEVHKMAEANRAFSHFGR
jgi:small subunit ribosomal protein S7